MLIDQVLYPVETLGPGSRVGIWIVGCSRKCPGCSNPELWDTKGYKNISVHDLYSAICELSDNYHVDGITITGGEPMDQAGELAELTYLLRNISKDILVYSGYKHEEILQDSEKEAVLSNIAVLIDGPYIENKNLGLALRGSANQNILLFDLNYEERYRKYIQSGRFVQNFYFNDQTVSVGIHDVGFDNDLTNKLQEMKVRRAKKDGT